MRNSASSSEFNELEWAAMLSSAAYAGCIGKTHDVEIVHQIADKATATQVRLEALTTSLPRSDMYTGFHRRQRPTEKNRNSIPWVQ